MGSEVKAENERVRVTRWTLSANEETGPHRHDHDYVVVPLTDARMAVLTTDGSETVAALTTGEPYVREAGVEHNVRNPDQGVLDFVEVELLD